MTTVREIRLKSRPHVRPTADNFELAAVELPAPRDDKVDVRNLGMAKAPEAFLGLFSGKKLGKMLVKLA